MNVLQCYDQICQAFYTQILGLSYIVFTYDLCCLMVKVSGTYSVPQNLGRESKIPER